METIELYCFFIRLGLGACLFIIFASYLKNCWKNWNIKNEMKRQYNNDLFRQRCKFLHNNIKNYYYTLAINNPELLAVEIADAHVSKMKRKNMIYSTYSKLKTASR